MDKVQLAQRNEYPHSIELDSIPRELLEMICHFLNSEDIAQLSGVNHSLNMSLSQRAVEIGKAGIVKALSDGRADQAFSMLNREVSHVESPACSGDFAADRLL